MNQLKIDVELVHQLINSQFPKWKDLSIEPVALSGWDNRTFHLGEKMLVRMPSSEQYVAQVEKEHKWLPKLAPLLPLEIPEPLAMGQPDAGYPWKWSVYRWIEGDVAIPTNIADLCDFAKDLAHFLIAFQRIDSAGGPAAGPHSFYRGGSLKVYDEQMRQAIDVLKDKIEGDIATEIWDRALNTHWNDLPVWVHGDISAGNLLVQNGKLSAVIDFGQLAVGDPSCDLMIAWTLFEGESRDAFRSILSLDSDTWDRARAWTLWKAMVVAAGFTNPSNHESARCWHIIDQVLIDH